MSKRGNSARLLSSSRLNLRPHQISDFEASAELWADPAVVRYINGTSSSREDSWARLLRYIGHWQAMDFGFWVVEDNATGQFLGEVGFADFKREINPPLGSTPEAGWVLIPSCHGLGIASEAVSTMLAWADQNLSHSSTVCIMDPDNKASVRVAEKNGYITMHMAEYRGTNTLVMERMKLSPAP